MLVKRSVTRTLARPLTAIILLAILSTSIALLTIAGNISNAEAVNVAGSLRMQSYRLAYDLTSQPQDIDAHLSEYRRSLLAPSLRKLTRFYVPERVREEYVQLLLTWRTLEQQLQHGHSEAFLQGLAAYVSRIDHFVLALQHYSEQNMTQVGIVMLSGLLAIMGLVLFALRTTRREVVAPLNKLLSASRQIQNGQFSPLALDSDLPNELGVLSTTFSRMAGDLEKLYRSLEDKVQEKTLSLTQANRTLSVLFDASQALTVSQITRPGLEKVLDIVRRSEQLDFLQLDVTDRGQGLWSLHSGQEPALDKPDAQPVCEQILSLDGQPLGILRWPAHQSPQPQLMQNVANMLSRAIYLNRMQKQQMQLLLMEERSTIARELHDSLAQALSFLRIQITLLRRSTDPDNPKAQAIIRDFEQALNDAYRQLRELLTTFRLTIEEADLQAALQQLLAPLREQSQAQIALHCALSSQSLNAQQQVHVLQIVREAVLNAIKHADAQHITVCCDCDKDEQNVIRITDDGVGIATLKEPEGHYGLTIMAERAARLGGKLEICATKQGGTEVRLSFDPVTANSVPPR
ncbi:nitrate/nitrite two-component system sensor histidine kinase NarQ [Plesiomonas shigelloides]|uniref:nitrate/nitrite two-component system sensor histidine kinase NarQ n=1 Tax=Plesiomonas shigelloides TaxID=703 RepID=UPI001C5BAD07|nr:nitrate/nitrite two-component system sensor histidine kinase NarQ [Plesiomonas shigelloides]MBW3793631.1 nitrate/nitrite two-component system sensor histidine kinase NarQ [Plesiomonas shigelloides]